MLIKILRYKFSFSSSLFFSEKQNVDVRVHIIHKLFTSDGRFLIVARFDEISIHVRFLRRVSPAFPVDTWHERITSEAFAQKRLSSLHNRTRQHRYTIDVPPPYFPAGSGKIYRNTRKIIILTAIIMHLIKLCKEEKRDVSESFKACIDFEIYFQTDSK